MDDGGVGLSSKPPDQISRASLCFSGHKPGSVVHHDEDGFIKKQSRLYSSTESIAIERIINLKKELKHTSTSEFWERITEGLASITGAQYCFVSKRVVKDDENVAVEMPPIGMPGSCLLGLALYISDGLTVENRLKNFKYHAYSCPCAFMRHDKIFVIPDHLEQFIVDNPNTLPLPAEAYVGIPLFAEDKCIGHFGLMWSPEGARKRTLGWGHTELLLHTVEDIILNRMLEGRSFVANAPEEPSRYGHVKVIPHDFVSVTQSLKPYARSLSHELRTPMQGVVGMLDVMYATVEDAVAEQKDKRVLKVLAGLKENIEVIQDSSRRAVEAADNIVHAYDMNMGVPETPATPFDEDSDCRRPSISLPDKRPDIVVAGNNMHLNLRGNKRKRDPVPWEYGSVPKFHAPYSPQSTRESNGNTKYPDGEFTRNLVDAVTTVAHNSENSTHADAYSSPRSEPSSPVFATERNVVPGLRHTNLQDVLQYIVNDSLKVGGRPESAIAQETERGEIIEVRTRSPSGEEEMKIIEWSVDKNVPESMLIDERDLSKMISCIVLNSIKFTTEGKITITARVSKRCRYIIINVKDTGSGIPTDFLPNLFKPFVREDDSLTRTNEGLGLGLLVAKGLARKLGGDLRCVYSRTSGPEKGCDFEMRVPLTPSDVCSRHHSPTTGSPTPGIRSHASVEAENLAKSPIMLPGAAKPVEDLVHEHRFDSVQTPPHTSAPPNMLLQSPLRQSSPVHRSSSPMKRRLSTKNTPTNAGLAKKYPLNFLVAEDNKINRSILVNMLKKMGYNSIREAYDGADAVRKMTEDNENGREVDVILMDLWMPFMDGYEATERILKMGIDTASSKTPTILAVTADVTDGALERAAKAGMKGFMTKPYKLVDLERLIVEYCTSKTNGMTV